MIGWLDILLHVLPVLLEILNRILERNRRLSTAEKKRIDSVLWYMKQFEQSVIKLGATKGGTEP